MKQMENNKQAENKQNINNQEPEAVNIISIDKIILLKI